MSSDNGFWGFSSDSSAGKREEKKKKAELEKKKQEKERIERKLEAKARAKKKKERREKEMAKRKSLTSTYSSGAVTANGLPAQDAAAQQHAPLSRGQSFSRFAVNGARKGAAGRAPAGTGLKRY